MPFSDCISRLICIQRCCFLIASVNTIVKNKNNPWWIFCHYCSPIYRSCGELVPRDKSTIKRHQGIYTKKRAEQIGIIHQISFDRRRRCSISGQRNVLISMTLELLTLGTRTRQYIMNRKILYISFTNKTVLTTFFYFISTSQINYY